MGMKKYLKKVAWALLKEEINEKNKLIKESQKAIEALSRDIKKIKNELSLMSEDHKIILKDYKVDNIGSDGIPPSYLPVNDEKLYKAKIQELNDVFNNETFREMLAYALNFHANLAVTGKVKNENGDVVDIPTEHVQHMVRGIKSIWELISAARKKKRELDTSNNFDPYAIIDLPTEEGSL